MDLGLSAMRQSSASCGFQSVFRAGAKGQIMRTLWLASALVLGTTSLLAQTPGVPVLTVNGPLSCGVRLYGPNQVQTYCFYLAPPLSPQVLICNALDLVNSGTAAPVAVYKWCGTWDSGGSMVYNVSWFIIGTPSSGTIQYEIATSSYPCTLPGNPSLPYWGQTCQNVIGTTNEGPIQTGTLQSDP
jgi:hypothetical protein